MDRGIQLPVWKILLIRDYYFIMSIILENIFLTFLLIKLNLSSVHEAKSVITLQNWCIIYKILYSSVHLVLGFDSVFIFTDTLSN